MNNLLKYGSIGVMDSGIGGLTILGAIANAFPKLNLVYYGDNLNAPYGNKSLRELKMLATRGIERLVTNGARIIVVACNTLSTTVLDYLKAISPVPVIPTVPIFNYDKKLYKCPTLIATPNTIFSPYVQENFKSFNLVPLPFLAGEIERWIFNPKRISVEKDLTAVPEATDYLYLGCTHYIFVKDRISAFLNVGVFDNALSVVSALKEALTKASVKNMPYKPYINFVGEGRDYNLNVFKKVLFKKNTHKFIANP